jgi:HTH-type transcriptional regulator, sugar sensing transcriptional regulator
MTEYDRLKNLGLSQYESSCYLALVSWHPVNGSQLSRRSGIARSRIYDVLRNLIRKGFVLEAANGQYVPLPPEELYKRLQGQFDDGLEALKEQVAGASPDTAYEFIWSIRGFDQVMAKAREMIAEARRELYVRLFPESGNLLVTDLLAAEGRGVRIRYISMGEVPVDFDIQVVHPNSRDLIAVIGGRSFDIIADKSEALVGIFEEGQELSSPINWTRNRWFVIANRDSLRHDFYHYFLEKIYDRGQTLDERDKRIYAIIKGDN